MNVMKNISLFVAAMAVVATLNTGLSAQIVPYFAFGSGSYNPVSGDVDGTGMATYLGPHTWTANTVTTPTDNPLVFTWETKEPVVAVGLFGTLTFGGTGTVELIPLNDTEFTAIWTGTTTDLSGTGIFVNVQSSLRPLRFVAINNPFTFADPEWEFNWVLYGRLRLN